MGALKKQQQKKDLLEEPNFAVDPTVQERHRDVCAESHEEKKSSGDGGGERQEKSSCLD